MVETMKQEAKKICYVSNNRINKDKWNCCVSAGKPNLAYAHSNYLDVVCKGEWDALIYGDYEAVFPLPIKKKWGLQYIVQPAFCQQLGAFGNDEHIGTEAFIKRIPWRFVRVRLQLNPYFALKDIPIGIDGTAIFHTQKPNRMFLSSLIKHFIQRGVLQQKDNFILPLLVVNPFNKDAQKNIKALESLEIRYKKNEIGYQEVIQTYRTAWGHLNPDISQKTYDNFAMACHKIELNAFTVSAHSENDELLGAAIFLSTQGNENEPGYLHYVCAGPTVKGKTLGIMHGILNHVIQSFKNRNMVLDFEGSSIESVAAFYKKFNAQNAPFWVLKRGI
ncbi:MAG: hypothetical protein CK532_04235 [Flavobacteriales bacterium]|nr:MAG: hypothetical protein CK532_04235 [Flavobacteriales bacterium]